MRRLGWFWASCISSVFCLALFIGCGGEEGDNNLPTRRARMRQIKLSTDRIIVAMNNGSLEDVADDAKKIQSALDDVILLYPPEHKAQYVKYNQEAQTVALAIAANADRDKINIANRKFRELVPYCGKCHEDCAFLLAPGFPEYEE